jgi:hypothetical protein
MEMAVSSLSFSSRISNMGHISDTSCGQGLVRIKPVTAVSQFDLHASTTLFVSTYDPIISFATPVLNNPHPHSLTNTSHTVHSTPNKIT